MKTVVKIDPELEYQNAKNVLAEVGQELLDSKSLHQLDASLENLITVARVLMEREDKRRGKKKVPRENKIKKGRKKGQERKEIK